MFKFFNKILGNSDNDQYILKHDKDKQYRKFINGTGFNVFLSLCVIICIISIYIVSTLKPNTEFYMVDTVKKEIKTLKTYPRPIISPKAIEDWASKATLDIFTFNFTNIDQHLNSIKMLFTPDGFSGFKNSLEKSGVLNTVRESSLEVFITPIEKPIIVDIRGDSETNSRVWNVEIQAFVSYIGTGEPKNEKVIVSLKIQQVPTDQNPNGIAISVFRLIKL